MKYPGLVRPSESQSMETPPQRMHQRTTRSSMSGPQQCTHVRSCFPSGQIMALTTSTLMEVVGKDVSSDFPFLW